MNKEFIVCTLNELESTLEKENKKHKTAPKIYYAGYSYYSTWINDGYMPESEKIDVKRWYIDYTGDDEDIILDKFYDYVVLKTFKAKTYEKIIIGCDYHIDVYFNDVERDVLCEFWHTTELSKEEIECLNDLTV